MSYKQTRPHMAKKGDHCVIRDPAYSTSFLVHLVDLGESSSAAGVTTCGIPILFTSSATPSAVVDVLSHESVDCLWCLARVEFD
jgi:hypothetical protein